MAPFPGATATSKGDAWQGYGWLVDALIAVHVVAFLVWLYMATIGSKKNTTKATHQD